MTVEADITSILKALCQQVHRNFADIDTPRPYVTYQQVGGLAVRYTNPEIPNLKNGEFQVNVWADTAKEAKALIEEIEAALIVATQFQTEVLGAPIGDFDADIPVHGYRQDFSIWSSR